METADAVNPIPVRSVGRVRAGPSPESVLPGFNESAPLEAEQDEIVQDDIEQRLTMAFTFCVTRSAHISRCGGHPFRAIQELAGHQDLSTTQRYMHLSPAAFDAAIRLLETGTESSRVAVEK